MRWKTLVLLALVAVACNKKKEAAEKHAAKPGGGGPPAANLPPQPQADLDEVVAIVDGQTITVADFQNRINQQSPYVRARYTSLEQKKDFLDNWIRFEVLAKEAKKKGYDQDPEVVAIMKQTMIQKLMQEKFESAVKPEDVTEAEMKKFYDEHISDYNKPEEVRVSAVITKSKDTAVKALEEAKALPAQDNVAFRDLVDRYSEDADSKARGGDLRFFASDTNEVPNEVVKAAFALQQGGEVAGPVQTQQGLYYVIKQTGRRPAINKPFDEVVKRQIQNRIYRDKRNQALEQYVNDLRKQANVQVNGDALARVRIDTTAPPSVPAPGESEKQ